MKRIAAVLMLSVACGCSTTPRYDRAYGEAVRQARLNMTIDPQAGSNPDQVAGIDGKAALESVRRYGDSFKAPPPVVNVINIGGGIGSNTK
ncbi:MAG: hypothetical protein K0S28_1743 [Paucimonas sp.]|jgi:hypothetical protein|nr:hypothetical protein [Paucimonas sp.]